MAADIAYVVLIAGVVLAGLWISNILYDLKVPHYISRKVSHIAGGVGFLLFVLLFEEPWWPIVVSCLFVLLMSGAKLISPSIFRGTGGGGRLSELWYPVSGVLVFTVGWAWLNQPVLCLMCFLAMAWGDSATSFVRYKVYGRPVKGLWGSAAMFATCLILAWAFVEPFWVGAVTALAATIAEWACGDVGVIKCVDDNIAIPVVSLATLFGILALIGGL
ncbi:hypothetical protein ES703_84131 [subsurface metagenome]